MVPCYLQNIDFRYFMTSHLPNCNLSSDWCFCHLSGISEEYQPPFFDMVPQDPSFDEMKKVVVTEKRRPTIPNRWVGDNVCNFRERYLKTSNVYRLGKFELV